MSLFSSDILKTSFWMVVNFFSCVWIIWSTKICFQLGFHYATTLTALHFFLTYIGLEISAACNFFERKKIPLSGVLPLSIAFCGFIVFNNLSLQYNTIGIYQVTKVLTTPLIVIINLACYSKWISGQETISLVLVCVGVIIATETNLDLNFAGLVTGFLGVISSSVYQIWVETKQHDFHCSPAQLLYHQAPLSCLLLIPVILLTEPVGEIFSFKMNWEVGIAIFGSAILAFLVNLSTYIVIGSTSPLTYNMIGHSKLVIIILSSYLFFGEKQSLIGVLGVTCAVVGIIAYAQIRMNARAQQSEDHDETVIEDEKIPLVDVNSTTDESTQSFEEEEDVITV
jgi:solute carrier family 35 protein E3